MPDPEVRFDPTFFEDLDRLFADERSIHGAPSRMDFLLFDLSPLRDSLAADFVGSTAARDPHGSAEDLQLYADAGLDPADIVRHVGHVYTSTTAAYVRSLGS